MNQERASAHAVGFRVTVNSLQGSLRSGDIRLSEWLIQRGLHHKKGVRAFGVFVVPCIIQVPCLGVVSLTGLYHGLYYYQEVYCDSVR